MAGREKPERMGEAYRAEGVSDESGSIARASGEVKDAFASCEVEAADDLIPSSEVACRNYRAMTCKQLKVSTTDG